MVLHLIASRQYRKALDELELSVQRLPAPRQRADSTLRYLPSPPFQENSVLNAYAGLICLYLAQPHRPCNQSNEGRSLRDAQQYFDRAKYLDQDNMVATAWSNAVRLPEPYSNLPLRQR